MTATSTALARGGDGRGEVDHARVAAGGGPARAGGGPADASSTAPGGPARSAGAIDVPDVEQLEVGRVGRRRSGAREGSVSEGIRPVKPMASAPRFSSSIGAGTVPEAGSRSPSSSASRRRPARRRGPAPARPGGRSRRCPSSTVGGTLLRRSTRRSFRRVAIQLSDGGQEQQSRGGGGDPQQRRGGAVDRAPAPGRVTPAEPSQVEADAGEEQPAEVDADDHAVQAARCRCAGRRSSTTPKVGRPAKSTRLRSGEGHHRPGCLGPGATGPRRARRRRPASSGHEWGATVVEELASRQPPQAPGERRASRPRRCRAARPMPGPPGVEERGDQQPRRRSRQPRQPPTAARHASVRQNGRGLTTTQSGDARGAAGSR